MSPFTVKKIKKQEKKTLSTWIPIPSQDQTKKYLRYFVGTCMLFIGLIFAWNYGIQALWNIQIANKTPNFTPLIFSWVLSEEKKEVKNILIAGIGWRGHDGGDLTDSIMLAQVNEETWHITLLSIPRDLYVAYPGKRWAWRINSLYGMGKSEDVGINYLAQKISEITGQSVHHYMVVDFRGFEKIVDVLGGITVDVPEDLIDPLYPVDGKDRYTTLVIRQWEQVFDGATALKYARSRHSTSDFDRSIRQQLIIKAIKDTALNGGFLTQWDKIKELYTTVIDHLDTDLTISDMIGLGLIAKDIQTENINIYNLNNECIWVTNCRAGAYLYNPSREYFWGAAGLLPENATPTRMSYYDDIHRFSHFIFSYPTLRESPAPIQIIYKKSQKTAAQNLWISLQKLGFHSSSTPVLYESTGALTRSYINIYSQPEMNLGFTEKDTIIQALREVDETLPYIYVTKNEFITNDGPKIEIIIGDDIKNYFTFAKPAYYLPNITKTGSTTPSESTGSTVSGEAWVSRTTNPIKKTPASPKIETTPKTNTTNEYSILPGEWENF